ncbi:AAA family ATPase [Brevundimonas huaxiensis]|nr:AAA family ATPase [Brevundimonas huaxiensis]MBC1184039.1 AAA family ATPase [Brevundimonas huaxiensis]
MNVQGRIWLITGLMAAGKSSVAQALAERLSPSVHIRGDLFRRMIVNGREEMSPTPSAGAVSQLELRYNSAWRAASAYADAGFHVALQDVVLGRYLRDAAEVLAQYNLSIVVLTPSYETLAARDRDRPKTAYGAGWTAGRTALN